MFEPVDFHGAEEVRSFLKFHISELLFCLPKLDIHISQLLFLHLKPGMSIDLYICSSD